MVAQRKRNTTIPFHNHLSLAFFLEFIVLSRTRHCKLSVATAPYAMPITNKPEKYVLSLRRVAGGRSGVQLALNCGMLQTRRPTLVRVTVMSQSRSSEVSALVGGAPEDPDIINQVPFICPRPGRRWITVGLHGQRNLPSRSIGVWQIEGVEFHAL
jgi:hypothetical protein